jgi:hypothetical protein
MFLFDPKPGFPLLLEFVLLRINFMGGWMLYGFLGWL